MGATRNRVVGVWRDVLALSWPVMVEHVFRTLMRTTDIVVTGLFSPAAVAALGLADIYARLPLRIGLGLGSGAIALSSQDTGGEAIANRDEAITQALLIGVLAGIPFVAFGALVGRTAIAVLGAPPDVARMGGTYLAIIFATAPARHVALVGARSLQGMGDTRTPMYVNIASNGLNVIGSASLGLGLFGLPRLAIVGVGMATAFGNGFTAVALLLAIHLRTDSGLGRPRDPTITRQLLIVSIPRVTEGFADTAAQFPFNALLLLFGTEVNAAYQIGRRMYQQVTAPLARGLRVGSSVLVGQALGQGEADRARFNGWATAALGLLTVGTLGLAVVAGAEWFVRLFTRHPETVAYATAFARTYGVAAPATVLFIVIAGALEGGSETRGPFVARTTGVFGFMLGFSYLASVVFGYGVPGIYAGIVLLNVWAAAIVVLQFHRGGWASRAEAMMADRRGTADGTD